MPVFTSDKVKTVYQQLRDRTQMRTSAVLVTLCLIFAFFFLPDEVLSYVKERLGEVAAILTGLGFGTLGGSIIGWMAAIHDALAMGNSKTAKFFNNQYPSNAIQDHYNCTLSEKNRLWFELYNPWNDIKHPQHESYVRTLEIGFECRFIFTVQWSLVFFFLISVVTWGVSWALGLFWYPLEETGTKLASVRIFTRGLFLIGTLVAIALLHGLNRLSPTGCWKRWRDINGIPKAWLKTEVYANAPTYNDAVNLLKDPQWKQDHGYT